MTSFFRLQIAQKVLPFLKSNHSLSLDLISSLVKVNRKIRNHPELLLPWSRMLKVAPDIEKWITPPKLADLLKNQGLPTADGIIDIGLSEASDAVTFQIDKHVFSKFVLTDIYCDEKETIRNNCLFCHIPLKKIVVLYNLPSVGESFSITDFRCIIHSNFIANINKFVGNEVIKIYNMADFSLKSALLMTGYKEFGMKIGSPGNPNNPLEILKVSNKQYKNDSNFRDKVDKCFKDMECGEHHVISEWHELHNLHLKQHDSLFKKLNLDSNYVHFDASYSSEIRSVYEHLYEKNIISHNENGKLKINIAQDSPLKQSFYFDRMDNFCYSLCSALNSIVNAKKSQDFDELYFVGPSSKKEFFYLLFACIQKMGYDWADHLKFIQMNDFCSNRRKHLSAEAFLQQAKLLMLNKLKTDLHLEDNESLHQTADELSYASVHMFDMKHKRNSDYLLNWNEILHLGKDSGAAFQLCHAGLKGLQEDSEFIFDKNIDVSPLTQYDAHKLISHLSRFDEIIYKSYLYLGPHSIYQYLSSLWYYTDKITNELKLDIKSDRLIVIKARLLLLSATLKTLQKCLNLLGLEPYVDKGAQQKML